MTDTKRMDIGEFRDDGYLQEVNRRFLHPLGLALEVVSSPDGTWRLGGIWDYRDDPEGLRYVVEPDEAQYFAEKAQAIDDLWDDRTFARVPALGYMVQPVGKLVEAVDAD